MQYGLSVDRLTKYSRFIPMKVMYSVEKLGELYVNNVVRFHGVLLSIISNRDVCFTFNF